MTQPPMPWHGQFATLADDGWRLSGTVLTLVGDPEPSPTWPLHLYGTPRTYGEAPIVGYVDRVEFDHGQGRALASGLISLSALHGKDSEAWATLLGLKARPAVIELDRATEMHLDAIDSRSVPLCAMVAGEEQGHVSQRLDHWSLRGMFIGTQAHGGWLTLGPRPTMTHDQIEAVIRRARGLG